MKIDEAIKRFEEMGFTIVPNSVEVKIRQPRENLWAGIQYFTKEKAQWLPEYEKVAEWLADNQGRGLLCLGNNGRGKTLLCNKVIPILLDHYCHRIVSCYSAKEMNDNLKEVIQKHIIYIDDVGTENIKVDYGERTRPFAELVDAAEKKGKLLIITSNLTIDMIKEKYGEGTADRLKAITKLVIFNGASLRQ